MKVGALIKNLFIGIFVAPILGGIVWVILFVISLALIGFFDFAGLGQWLSSWNTFFIISILCYPLSVFQFYQNEKKETTCPRCKTPFSYYVKNEGYKTLSSDYISEDVKQNDGSYRRQGFKVGKRKHYYTGTCEECGFSKSWQEVKSYKDRA